MAHWTKEQGRESLATISTLKRIMGIPNLPGKKDRFDDKEIIYIYTPDKDSAILLGELLWRFGNGPREAFYNAHPDLTTIRDTACVEALADGGYVATMHIPHSQSFTKALEKMIRKHTAPDTRFTR